MTRYIVTVISEQFQALIVEADNPKEAVHKARRGKVEERGLKWTSFMPVKIESVILQKKDFKGVPSPLTEKDVEQIVSRMLDAAEKKRARQVFLDDYS